MGDGRRRDERTGRLGDWETERLHRCLKKNSLRGAAVYMQGIVSLRFIGRYLVLGVDRYLNQSIGTDAIERVKLF